MSHSVKPYYESGGIAVYNASFIDVLPMIKTVDLVLTDPPYGINLQSHGHWFRGVSVHGDESQSTGQQAMDLCAQNRWPTIAFSSPRRPWAGDWSQHLVWDKGPALGIGGDRETCWKMSWEMIQVRGMRPLNGQRDEAVLRYHTEPGKLSLHPCQKPVNLLGYLIQKATAPWMVVLDPFMGSGSTLVADKECGRRAIGVEVEEKYCEIAVRRLAQEVLFGA